MAFNHSSDIKPFENKISAIEIAGTDVLGVKMGGNMENEGFG